jgi:hypothetical protein
VAKERKEKGNENQDESKGRQPQREVVNLKWPGPRGPEDDGDNKRGIARKQENLKTGFPSRNDSGRETAFRIVIYGGMASRRNPQPGLPATQAVS